MFSAPGVASVLTFQKCCHFQLSATNDLDKSNISVIAAQVKEKAVKNCEDGETMYKVHFGSGWVNEAYSSTLMELLAEILILELYSIMIGTFWNFSLLWKHFRL